MNRDEYLDRWSRLHGGYDPRAADAGRAGLLVRGWLALVHALARPFAALRVAPDVLTVVGGLLAVVVVWLAVLGGRWVLVAAAVVVLSGLVDSLDGAVAVMSGRTTAFGSVLDSLVDRCSDLLYVAALYVVGAPLPLCLVAGVLAFLLEYARARAGGLGMSEIGAVTVAERPTRVIVTAMFLLGAGLYVDAAQPWATAGALAWTTLGAVACVQLAVVVRRRLG